MGRKRVPGRPVVAATVLTTAISARQNPFAAQHLVAMLLSAFNSPGSAVSSQRSFRVTQSLT